MIKRMLLISSMLLAQLTFCQGTYPNIVVVKNDTVCQLLLADVRDINTTFLSLKESNEIVDSLSSIIIKYDSLRHTDEIIIKSLNKEVEICEEISREKALVITSFENENKSIKKSNKKLKTQRNILFATTIVGIAAVFLLFL